MDKYPKWLVGGLVLLFAVPVWSAGGTYKAWQDGFLWVGLLAWAGFFLEPDSKRLGTRRQRAHALLKDPAVWASVGFILFLIVQYLNTGRMRVWDFNRNVWSWTPPPHPNLPWSFARDEAFEMIHWFVPILSGFLILRHSWKGLPLRDLAHLICLNGFLNALLSFVHLYLDWEYMYNFKRFGKDVYGSFGYPNHGAMYFILLFALSFGLLMREVFTESAEREAATFGLNAFWAPVFFLAANLSTSRAGILGPWLVLLLTLGTIGVLAWPRIHPVERLYGIIAMVVAVVALAGGFLLFAEPVHLRELRSATTQLDPYDIFYGRWFQIQSAFDIWLDHPVYGVGGWGYRYLVAEYLPRSDWRLLGIGRANVHNDFMQFLAEFGLIGMGCLLVVFASTLRDALRHVFASPTRDESLWASPLRISCLWGVVILILVSQIDIPLRSPAVFLHGVLLWMILLPHREVPSLWVPVIDWSRLQPPALRIRNKIRDIEPEGREDPPVKKGQNS